MGVDRFLLSRDTIRVDERAPDQATALMLAARNGHLAIVKALLDKGADPLLRNLGGQIALDLAPADSATRRVLAVRTAARLLNQVD